MDIYTVPLQKLDFDLIREINKPKRYPKAIAVSK